MNMKGGCDCYECKYYKEVFMDDLMNGGCTAGSCSVLFL